MLSSLYIGATGIKAHAEGMQVTGNNIANVNTTAFKNAQIRFGDLLSDNVVSASANGSTGMAQAGLGVGVQDVVTMFASQGAFETTNEATDVAISGNGYFAVRDPSEEDGIFYTRAGNFRFNHEGFLVDPLGNIVQGKTVDLEGQASEATMDIRLRAEADGPLTLAPKATEEITLATNLDRDEIGDPNTATLSSMLANYNGLSSGEPLTESQYNHRDTISVFDSAGESQTLSVYYGVVGEASGTGENVFGYIVGIDPSQDGSALAGTSSAGIVMSGTLSFNSTGQLISQTAYTYDGDGTPSDLTNWTLAPLNAGSSPSFTATYSSGSTITSPINFGLTATTGAWSGDSTLASAVAGGSNLPTFESEGQATSSTAFAGSSYNLFQDQDGYPLGTIMEVRVDQDGVIVGRFSNGEDADLFQLTLYDFTNEYGLTREGNNLYSTNLTTGVVTEGVPDDGFFGQVAGATLETSNTDLAREFTTMITTQRGFQANSKIITTSDSLLQTAIQLKR